MHKLNKIIKFFLNNLVRLVCNYITIIFPRNKNIWLFNCVVNNKNKNAFTHNTKYLYLYLSQHPEYGVKAIWLSTDKNIVKTLKNQHYKAIYKYSLQGLFYCLRAKYYILNVDSAYHNEISRHLCGGAILINLWHGIPLKTIGLDATSIYVKLPEPLKKVHKWLRLKSDYFISNSNYDTKIFLNAFNVLNNQLKTLGSPRIDTIYNMIEGEKIFMEDDTKNIFELKKQNKKILLYIPTFRETGKNISTWLQNPKLKEILEQNNAILICKLHPVDSNSLPSIKSNNFYKMANNSDINAVLKYTDALITDYSSVYFDYLLLDKPILYYVPDLEEYQEKCHGFYGPYEELTAGVKAYNEDELIQAMQDTINGIDNYKEQRKLLRDKMFKYQDGRNCERVVEWIKSLDENKGE